MIILSGHTKGGVGKSTVAILLAVARAAAGRKVWVIDGDRQKSTALALQVRADAPGDRPFIAVSEISDGRQLRTQVLGQADQFDDIIIDAGGRDSTAMRAALTVVDVALVPLEPRAFGAWALDDLLAMVDEANSVRDGLRVVAFLNRADPAGPDNAQTLDEARKNPQLEVVTAKLGDRKAFPTAAARGASVLDGKDPKAVEEMQSLIDSIFQST